MILKISFLSEWWSGFSFYTGPSVSSGKSISIIHCSDLEEESYQTEVLKLYDHFSEKLGYKCHLDKLEMWKIAENKFRYALRRVQHSDFVFICVSPELKRIFDSSLEDISEQLEGWLVLVLCSNANSSHWVPYVV